MSNISENGSCDTATIQSTLYFDSKIDNGEDSEMNGDETSQKHDYQAALDRIGWQENIVAVKSEYRISRKEIDIRLNHKQSSNNANDSDIGNPENDKNENNESRENRDSQYSKSGRYKNKRPRDNAEGVPCQQGENCPYIHDLQEYMKLKPEDIGTTCYQFQTFGYCPNGIMCRFGGSHIDKATCMNVARPPESGGVVERVKINALSAETQRLLWKKKYDFSNKAKGSSRSEHNSSAMKTSHDSEGHSSDIMPSSGADTDAKSADYNFSYYDQRVKLVDFRNKVYVAPLTTVGNLPFRRILTEYGADITCGEMALSYNLLQGQQSEWALLRRHASEKCFGIQVAGAHSDQLNKIAQLLDNETESDFVDLNCGCPIDVVCNRGSGSALLHKPAKLCDIVKGMLKYLHRPITVKIRTGWNEKDPVAHKLVPMLQKISNGKIAAIMIHGRSRLQRYTKSANWNYIHEVAKSQDVTKPVIPIIGNGDILTYEDWKAHQHMVRDGLDVSNPEELGIISCAMIGRGALIKPWLPQEIKEERHIDISPNERLGIIEKFCNYGLEHWGSDQQGVNNTRRFLLEWLSFLHRYVPYGITDQPQKMQQRPPYYFGRSDLETILASSSCSDWIKISEMFLGPVPDGYQFEPKHKSNAYAPESDILSNG